MEYLTPDYFRQVEYHFRREYAGEDLEVFMRTFKLAVANDPKLRAALAFFVLDEGLEQEMKIKVSISFFKRYSEIKQTGIYIPDNNNGESDSDDDSEDEEEVSPRHLLHYARLVRLARSETVEVIDLTSPSTSSANENGEEGSDSNAIAVVVADTTTSPAA